MQRVQQATQSPHHCAVIPFKGNSNSLGGFIDTGQHLGFQNEHKVYICMEAAVEIAKEIGWVSPSHRKGLEAQNAALKAENDQLRAEVKEADKFAEAAEYTLTKFGQKVARKPGRPKKETV